MFICIMSGFWVCELIVMDAGCVFCFVGYLGLALALQHSFCVGVLSVCACVCGVWVGFRPLYSLIPHSIQ